MLNIDRIERLQERMRAENIDAYLVLTHDDYLWLFGESRYQPRAIVPANGQPIIVTFVGEDQEVWEKFGVQDQDFRFWVPVADVSGNVWAWQEQESARTSTRNTCCRRSTTSRVVIWRRSWIAAMTPRVMPSAATLSSPGRSGIG